MIPTTFPFPDLLTPASLALLAARYPAQVAAACRRSLPPAMGEWDRPTDPEIERIMKQPPMAPERRVA